MKFRDWSGFFGLILMCLTMFTATCGDLNNRVGDSLQPAQSLGATVLGYSRFTQCDAVFDAQRNEERWECGYWSPERIVLRPYRSWLVAPRAVVPLLRWDYVLLEFVVGLTLFSVGVFWRNDSNE